MKASQAANTLDSQPPWYRVGMVWLMITLPLIVVLASLLTVAIAYQNAPNLIQTLP